MAVAGLGCVCCKPWQWPMEEEGCLQRSGARGAMVSG